MISILLTILIYSVSSCVMKPFHDSKTDPVPSCVPGICSPNPESCLNPNDPNCICLDMQPEFDGEAYISCYHLGEDGHCAKTTARDCKYKTIDWKPACASVSCRDHLNEYFPSTCPEAKSTSMFVAFSISCPSYAQHFTSKPGICFDREMRNVFYNTDCKQPMPEEDLCANQALRDAVPVRKQRRLVSVPTLSPTGSKPSASPTYSKPSLSPTYSQPSVSPTYSQPSVSPTYSQPSLAPTYSQPTTLRTKRPTTPKPSRSPTPVPRTSGSGGDTHFVTFSGEPYTCNDLGWIDLFKANTYMQVQVHQFDIGAGQTSIDALRIVFLTSPPPQTTSITFNVSTPIAADATYNDGFLEEVQVSLASSTVTLSGFGVTYLTLTYFSTFIDVFAQSNYGWNSGALVSPSGCIALDETVYPPNPNCPDTLMEPFYSFCNFDMAKTGNNTEYVSSAVVAADLFTTTAPTLSPTKSPTTSTPTKSPTKSAPTKSPTKSPSTSTPTKSPSTSRPTKAPSTSKPTKSPSTSKPTKAPSTTKPTRNPTNRPSSKAPSKAPTTSTPSKSPTVFNIKRCSPEKGLDVNQCQQRIQMCSALGIRLKWSGLGCIIKKVRKNDGGCQCDGYCGYKCKTACSQDRQCVWKQNKCFTVTGLPGKPITSCARQI